MINVKEEETILDPMAGSGTACVEAQLMNINAIGIDINPFCVLISRAKSYALDLNVDKLKDAAANDELFKSLSCLFEKTNEHADIDGFLSTICITGDSKVDVLILLAYLDAMGYARRRKRGSVERLFPRVFERYLGTVSSSSQTLRKLGIKLGKADFYSGNVLDLALPNNTIDAVITSPPYSFAIDYVENDRPQLEFLGQNVDLLKLSMVGLQGKSRAEQIRNYLLRMNKAISEMSRVLKSGKFCVIIVGSNEIQTGGIKFEKEFNRFAENHDLILRRDLVKSIEGIQNSMRNEHVLFFQKE